jgi:ABC-type Zn uptake system ZnuABC Zn-binding protein ZnuA
VRLYVDSLGEPGSEADSYIGMMRTNVRRIVEALR